MDPRTDQLSKASRLLDEAFGIQSLGYNSAYSSEIRQQVTDFLSVGGEVGYASRISS
jgi:hypothetical protein